jgi:hypothetical protein
MRLRSVFFILSIVLTSASTPALPDPLRGTHAECPADPELARLMADSELVVIGKATVPREAIQRTGEPQYRGHVSMPIRIEGLVKGRPTSDLTLRYFVPNEFGGPTRPDLLDLDDRSALFFLTSGDERPEIFYFARHSPGAIRPATETAVEAARVEAERQSRIDRGWRIDRKTPHFAEAQKLISRLGVVKDDRQQKVFDRLEHLGEAAVPAIVALMDDRRMLKTPSILLENHAENRFEKFRHYGPKQVVDGLAAILNQITGSSYGFIYNGATPAKRDAAVAAWRVHASDLPCGRP